MAMELLPSEVARLVYGYLHKASNSDVADMFLHCSEDMKECRRIRSLKNRRFLSTFQDLTLNDILDQYSDLCNVIFENTKTDGRLIHQNAPEYLKNILNARSSDELHKVSQNTVDRNFANDSLGKNNQGDVLEAEEHQKDDTNIRERQIPHENRSSDCENVSNLQSFSQSKSTSNHNSEFSTHGNSSIQCSEILKATSSASNTSKNELHNEQDSQTTWSSQHNVVTRSVDSPQQVLTNSKPSQTVQATLPQINTVDDILENATSVEERLEMLEREERPTKTVDSPRSNCSSVKSVPQKDTAAGLPRTWDYEFRSKLQQSENELTKAATPKKDKRPYKRNTPADPGSSQKRKRRNGKDDVNDENILTTDKNIESISKNKRTRNAVTIENSEPHGSKRKQRCKKQVTEVDKETGEGDETQKPSSAQANKNNKGKEKSNLPSGRILINNTKSNEQATKHSEENLDKNKESTRNTRAAVENNELASHTTDQSTCSKETIGTMHTQYGTEKIVKQVEDNEIVKHGDEKEFSEEEFEPVELTTSEMIILYEIKS